VIAFRSRYSLRLFEYVSGRINQQHLTSEKLEIWQIREVLAVQPLKLHRWKDLRVNALDLAIAEVNQLAGFKVHYKPLMRARSVWAIQLFWEKKERAELNQSARELDASHVGRKARRDGSAETVADAPIEFPSGSIRSTPFEAIARANLPAPIRDLDMVANTFRSAAKRDGKPLRGPHVTEMFAAFCRSQKPAY
jgi:hypothetical protein